MNWELDNITFQSYGVYVVKSSGVLDLPKLTIPNHNWLDEDDIEYWPVPADYRKNDREIKIDCLIIAGNQSDFESKVFAFWSVLKAENKRSLSCDYLADPIDAYLNKDIRIRPLSAWHESKQFGTFTLRLTVPGDSKFNLINISRSTSTNVVAIVKTNNFKISKTLQGAMSASMSFESNTKLDIQFEDFIQYEYDGNGFDRFVLNGEPQFTKKSTNKYVYNLTFEHQAPNYLARAQFLNDLGEADFYHYADLESVIELIITNYDRRGYAKFEKGTIPATIKKNHKFDNEDCFLVLKRICAEYELEFEFVHKTPSYRYDINVAAQVANTKAITFQYGKANGLYELTRGERLKDQYCNKVHAFGAAKNLKPDYRGGLRRLSFDGNPLFVPDVDPVEHSVLFDDILPQRTGSVGDYEQVLDTSNDPRKETWPNGIYKITDTSLSSDDPDYDLDINDYLIDGLTAKVVMKTGALAGYEFDIAKYDHGDQFIYIIPFNENGQLLPNATLQIAAGDEYTLVDIGQPAGYVNDAEDDLETAAMEYLAEHSQPKFEYRVKVDPKYILDNPMVFEVGDRVTVIDTDYNISGLFRVSQLAYNDYTKEYDITLSDKTRYPRLAILESKTKALERAASDTNSSEVETMKNSQETPGELRRDLLNPVDEKLNVDDIVRNNSLDPGMLSLDAGYIQLSLKNAMIEPNYLEDVDQVNVEAGTLRMHNFAPKSRYEIKKMKDDLQIYDPCREWDILETGFTLENSNPHWIYAKLNMASGSRETEIYVSEDHHETKKLVDTGYLIYKLASISGGTGKRHVSAVLGNVKKPTDVVCKGGRRTI